MLADKKLTDFTNLFSPYDFLLISKMHEIDKNKLSDKAKFRLYEIKKLKMILSMRLMKQNHAVKN